MNEEEFAELAAGYALDALSPEDLTAFESARVQHPEWESWVVMDAAAAAVLADGVTPVAPPAGARDALLARIAAMPQDVAPVVVRPQVQPPIAQPSVAQPEAARTPVAEFVEAAAVADAEDVPASAGSEERAAASTGESAPDTATIQAVSRRNWTRGMFGLAASLILLVALGFGAVTLGQLMNRPAAVAALDQIEAAPDAQTASATVTDGSGSATVHWSDSVGKVVVVSEGLPSIDRNQSFELWYIRGDTPVSAGTFDDAKSATVLLDGTLKTGDVIAMTVEQQGGSPTGQPTSTPIVTIPTA